MDGPAWRDLLGRSGRDWRDEALGFTKCNSAFTLAAPTLLCLSRPPRGPAPRLLQCKHPYLGKGAAAAAAWHAATAPRRHGPEAADQPLRPSDASPPTLPPKICQTCLPAGRRLCALCSLQHCFR